VEMNSATNLSICW